MHYFIRRPWELPQRQHTPPSIYQNRQFHRREFLASLGWTIAGAGALTLATGCSRGTDEEVLNAGRVDPVEVAPPPLREGAIPEATQEGASETSGTIYPARRNEAFTYGRDETVETEAARYTNFYEFSTLKSVWQHVAAFQTSPWQIQVDGLCAKPRTFDLDDLHRLMAFEERHYRHRCVETWAMCVPWTGFPLSALLKLVEPKAQAEFVALQTFDRPAEAPNQAASPTSPWPYTEGLTLPEAMNDLTLVATGMYGHPLFKQHGAPIRLVVPWKYGFKSIKSIVRITLTDSQPPTFWNTLAPHEYGFEANVEPDVPHPRWSQRSEKMLGTGERFDTVVYNGYGDYVARLYR
ncbi:MAG: protein-methionine-sulfoxide reductase catalytic subunit MsrP [Planctomycetales bacterium]